MLFDAQTHKLVTLKQVPASSSDISFWVRPGRYHLAALEDPNDNLDHDSTEWASFYGAPDVIEIEPDRRGGMELSMELTGLDPNPTLAQRSLGAATAAANPELVLNNISKVVELSDERFDPEVAEKGMWEPAVFVDQELHGLYKLEEYDPARTPVVFVHGIGGTPREFSAMVESLDETRFQAWVFYYPTALPLAAVGAYLHESIQLMQAKYKPGRIALIAHSMGGLVATEAVQQYFEASHSYLSMFVTLASPLGGIHSAQSGIDWAPTVMWCWYDLAPSSEFLANLYPNDTTRLPYYLLFAYKRSGLTAPSGDGVVPLSSQLRPTAQAWSTRMLGVDASHTGILSDPLTLTTINDLLLQHAAPDDRSGMPVQSGTPSVIDE